MGTVYRETYTKPLPSGAEVFTRKGERFARWTDRAGRKCVGRVFTAADGTDRVLIEARTYTAKFRDGTGRLRKVSTGCRDRDAALVVLSELERRAEKVRAGLLSAAEACAAAYQSAPLAEHIEAYVQYLANKRGRGGKLRTSAAHVRNARFRLHRIMAECGFTLLRDLNRPALEKWANTREAEGMPANTLNGYLLAACAFGNWCVETKRLTVNPFARPPKRDGKADQRRPRRALTEDELRRLLTVARLRPLAEYGRPTVKLAEAVNRENRRSRRTWRRAPLTFEDLQSAADRARARLRPDVAERLDQLGRERALLYKLLVLTGLRRGEAASLTVGSLMLDARTPYVALAAADAKSGHAAEIPLRGDLAGDLRAWLGERLDAAREAAGAKGLPLPARLPDDAPLFNVPPNLSSIFNRDLQAAGIPKRDDRGRVLDVHALRHTFGTYLSKGGVAPRVAQAAMRHSTLELTMNTYTDPRLLDVAGALDALPALPLDDRTDAQQAKATGTLGREAERCGLPEPVLSEENASRAGDRLYQKLPAEAGNRDVVPTNRGTYAPRSLVPTLVPTSGKTCTSGSLSGTSADDQLLGEIAGSAATDTTCASVSHYVEKPPAGLEPATCGLQNRCSAD